ncbi:MAG TPA: TIR domain-containing protein [Thermoanaerobaculia bacterium]|nr:TIR domain-containing protein [Thermoanaerobaculia bacterium]
MRYDAFISYSHAGDGRVAPALQSGLHRMARPWYRLRALHVFRDETNLGVSPQLWPRIVEALSESKALILLASPAAAGSKWVDQEVAFWKSLTPSRPLYLALTDGNLAWDSERQAFTGDSSAVPPALRDAFETEPLWVDVRTVRKEEDLSLKNPRFADVVATLGAALHGVDKNKLIGDDIRQQRIVRWLVASTIVVLLALTITAIMLFFGQRQATQKAQQATREAQQATEEARKQLRLATENLANQIASNTVIEQNGDAALVTAVAVSKMAETTTTTATLFTMLQRNRLSERLLHPTDQQINSNDIAMSANGAVAIVSYENTIDLWRPPGWQKETFENIDARAVAFAGERLFVLARGEPCELVELTPRGARTKRIPTDCVLGWEEPFDFAIAENTSVFAWIAGDEIVCRNDAFVTCDTSVRRGSARAIAVSPDGNRIAVATYDDDTKKTTIIAHAASAFTPTRSLVLQEDVLALTAQDHARLAVLLASGRLVSLNESTGEGSAPSAGFATPKPRQSSRLIAAITPRLDRIVTTDALEGVGIPGTDATLTMTSKQRLTQIYPAAARVVAIAPNGAAAVAACTASACDVHVGTDSFVMGESNITAAAFSSDGAYLAAASERRLKIWRTRDRFGVLDRPVDPPPMRLRFSTKAKTLLVETGSSTVPIGLNGKMFPAIRDADLIDIDDHGRLFLSRDRKVFQRSLDGRETSREASEKVLPSWADSDDAEAEVLAVSSDGAALVTGVSQVGEGLSIKYVVWNVADPKRPPLLIPSSRIANVAAGRRFVALTMSGVRLYDRANGTPASDEFTPGVDVQRIEFAGENDDFLVLHGSDGTVEVISLRPADLRRLACTIANRDLSPAEWAIRFSSRPYERVCSQILGHSLGTRW